MIREDDGADGTAASADGDADAEDAAGGGDGVAPTAKAGDGADGGRIFGEGVATLEVEARSRFCVGGSAMGSVVGVLAAVLREKCWLIEFKIENVSPRARSI